MRGRIGAIRRAAVVGRHAGHQRGQRWEREYTTCAATRSDGVLTDS